MADEFDSEPIIADMPAREDVYLTIILWLLALSGIMVLILLAFLSTTLQDDADRLAAHREAAQATLTAQPPPATVTAEPNPWPAALAAIGNYDPAEVTFVSVTQTGRAAAILQGRARDETAVRDYARALEQSGLFARVTIEAVRPLAAPPTATPLPPPIVYYYGDPFEVDDFAPRAIAVAQAQERTFFPIYDVDAAEFTAQAGRSYRISTARLSPGVDTALTVRVGAAVYQNDDRAPGDPASEVTIPAGGVDVHVVVYITNRAQYGVDHSYTLLVEEVQPTPTLPPTPTRPPTQTPTRAPTRPPSPTFTPFPTATATPFPSVTPESPAQPTATPFPTVTPEGSAGRPGRAAAARADPLGVEFTISLELQVAP